MESTFSLRDPLSTYLKVYVSHAQKSSTENLDEITVKTHLDAALNQYLGLTGMAVPVDILKVEDRLAWIRVPTDNEIAVVAALSQWVGKGATSLRVQGRATWLGALVDEDVNEKLWSMEE